MTTFFLLLKASVLLAAALVAAHLLGRGSASTRHGLWSATFVALLTLPLLGYVAPALYVPVPAAWRSAAPISADAVSPAVAVKTVSSGAIARTDRDATVTPVLPGPDAGTAWRGSRPSASTVAFAVWIAGTGASIALLMLSLVRVRRLAVRARVVDAPAWREHVESLGARLGLRRPARVVFSDAVRTPMAGGVWRPLIFLPAAAATWDGERRDIVLAHELSHLVRRDPLRHITARLALACYWFHPLAWLAAQQSSLAREQACDEAVLALGVRPSDYARVLLELAEGMTVQRATAALPMVERSFLETRLMAILDSRSRPAAARPIVAAAAAALVTLALAAAQPAVQATTTIVVPPAHAPRSQPPPSRPVEAKVLTTFVGGVVIESETPPSQPSNGDCWADDFHGSFRGSSSSFADVGGRTVVYDMIGTRNGDRVVQTHFGDLRVCMVAQGAVGLERGKPSEWSAPRVLIESRRGGSTHQMEIRDGRQLTWRINGTERPVDTAAQAWRTAMLAVLDTTWELSTLRGDVSTLRGEISTVRGEESTLRGQISTLRGEVSTMRGRQSTIRGDESSLRGEISTIRGHISTLRGQISTEQGAMTSLQANRGDASTTERDRIAARMREHESEIARLERELRDYDEAGRVAEVERRIQALDADRKSAAVDDEIRRFDENAKIAAVERQIAALNVDGKIADIERRIQALDADRRDKALEDRRDDELKRLEKADAAIR